MDEGMGSVVISGMAGRFPQSCNVQDFYYNLLAGVDLIDDSETRWKQNAYSTPSRLGKLKSLNEFDASYFGIPEDLADALDPRQRMLLELVCEALLDSGENPTCLRGSNTAVFTGMSGEDGVGIAVNNNLDPSRYAGIGFNNGLGANRISFYFDFRGPSVSLDTMCSSGLLCLDRALNEVRTGKSDRAIVASAHVLLDGKMSTTVAKNGILSADGACKVFDRSADGYVRSEAAVVLVICRASLAKRVYVTILNSGCSTDGFKDVGISAPSAKSQQSLSEKVWKELNMNPSSVAYVEAHGTGTQAGDSAELAAIENIYCQNRDCSSPLLVGSVKSVVGHCEPASGLVSIVKLIMSHLHGVLPGNLHFCVPNHKILGMKGGTLRIADNNVTWPGNLIAVNSFGFGGANAMAILKFPDSASLKVYKNTFPVLITFTGRTPEMMQAICDNASTLSVLSPLLHNIFSQNLKNYNHRGYAILSENGKTFVSTKMDSSLGSAVHIYIGDIGNKHLYSFFALAALPAISAFMKKSKELLKSYGFDIPDCMQHNFNYVEEKMLAVCAKLAIIDLFLDLGIAIVATNSEGDDETVLTYAEGRVTIQQALCTELRRTLSNQSSIVKDAGDPNLVTPSITKSHASGTPFLSEKSINTSLYGIGPNRSVRHKDFGILAHEGSVLVTLGSSCETRYLERTYEVTYELLDISDPVNHFLQTLGELHNKGIDIDLSKIYGQKLPVTTFPISPLVRWDRSSIRNSPKYSVEWERHGGIDVHISLERDAYSLFHHHKFNNKAIVPAAGYLKLVWDVFSHLSGFPVENLPIVFEDVALHRAVILNPASETVLRIQILEGDGRFCVRCSGKTVCTGVIRLLLGKDEDTSLYKLVSPRPIDWENTMTEGEIYQLAECCNVQFSGPFRSLRCTEIGKWANVVWKGNWITFLDGFLQMEILKNLKHKLTPLMPTRLKRILINPVKFSSSANGNCGDEVRVEMVPELKSSCCLGVEIRQIKYTVSTPASIEPELNLKSYGFAPFFDTSSKLSTHTEMLEFFLEIAMQNTSEEEFHILEFVTEGVTKPSDIARKMILFSSFASSKVSSFTPSQTSSQHITEPYPSAHFAVTMEDVEISLETIMAMLSSEFLCIPSTSKEAALKTHILVAQRRAPSGIFALLRRINNHRKPVCSAVQISRTNFSWVPQLQDSLRIAEEVDGVVIIYSCSDPLCGIIGLLNSLLREPRTANRVRCFFAPASSSEQILWTFSNPGPKLKLMLDLELVINVYQGDWGTLYSPNIEKEVLFGQRKTKEVQMVGQYGAGMSSLRFEKAPPFILSKGFYDVVRVHFVGLIYRDVMSSAFELDDQCKETIYKVGWEFSGKTVRSGRRVFGFSLGGALTPEIPYDDEYMIEIPSSWSLLEASTINISYATAYYALVRRAQLRPKEAVLIHAGAGGVGVAAIRVALSIGAKVYTTVGSSRKKQFLQKLFPQLEDQQIVYSRNHSAFEYSILKDTAGEGVHVVLNSLDGEGLLASLRCVRTLGRFVDIGKRDMLTDKSLSMGYLMRSVAYHTFDLAEVALDSQEWGFVKKSLTEGIRDGTVRPLPTKLYELNQTKEALTALGAGNTVGKLAVRIRKSGVEHTEDLEEADAFPKTYFDPNRVYIIIGGLGGMSLEICKWMVERGARKIFLTSRSGFRNAYQRHVVAILSEMGCDIEIYTGALSCNESCRSFLQHVMATKGEIDGLFNMAVSLQDNLFDKQSFESFATACEPKCVTTEALDAACRSLVPNIRYFVVFSSLAASIGSPGLTNYAFANSAMERIIERRRQDGYSGIAIQWGPVKNVGILSRRNIDTAFPVWPRQSIVSCIQVLDAILTYETKFSVIISVILGRKQDRRNNGILNVFRKALSLSSHVDDKTQLGDLGMDSLTRTEFELNLKKYNIDEIIDKQFDQITLQDIKCAIERKEASSEFVTENEDESRTVNISFGSDFRLQVSPPPIEVLVNVKSLRKGTGEKLFLVHALDGTTKYLENLATELAFDVWAFQCTIEVPVSSIGDVARFYINKMKEVQPKGPYLLGGYSFGAALAVEMALQLEKSEVPGQACKILLAIDGAPCLVKEFVKKALKVSHMDLNSGTILFGLNAYGITINSQIVGILRREDTQLSSQIAARRIAESIFGTSTVAAKNLEHALLRFHVFLKAAMHYMPVGFLPSTKVILLRAVKRPLLVSDRLTETYNLEEIAQNVEKFDVQGDHFSFHSEPTELGISLVINEMLNAAMVKVNNVRP